MVLFVVGFAGTILGQSLVDYAPTDEIFRNPERGFYTQFTGYSKNTQGFPVMEPVDGQLLDIFKADNQSLLLRLYYIPEFVDQPISAEFLDYVQKDMNTVREKGFKCILRFAYSVIDSMHADTIDAPLGRVLEHISQLTPILQKNADVIAVMQAGLIGAYGEWATFNNVIPDFADADGVRNLTGRKAVLDALLRALPDNRMVQIRTPYYTYAFYDWEGWTDDEEVFANPEVICPLTNPSGLTVDHAYDGTDRYRVAQHNDCFLASATDFGTYCDEERLESDWLENETKYTVMGGETCAPNPPRSDCASEGGDADTELNKFHWSFLNSGYHPDVLDGFIEQGCYDDIARSLGYRIELIQGRYPDVVTRGCALDIALDLRNTGYAAPFNPRTVEFILRNTATMEAWTVATDMDPRFWFKEAEAGVLHLTAQLGIPEDIAPGDYALLMHLPDPEPTLYGNPNYSIRLANAGVWEQETGFNNLLHSISIVDDACSTPYAGDKVFIPFGCNPGRVAEALVEYCCDDTVHLAVAQQSYLSTHTIGWALTEDPVINPEQVSLSNILDLRGPVIDFEIDCDAQPDSFYLTPFLAVNDRDFIYAYPDDLFQAYWGGQQEKTYIFNSKHIPYDPTIGGNMRIEIFNQDNYFSNNGGLSDIYIEYAATQEFSFLDVPTLPVGEATLTFDVDLNPNTVWRITIVDQTPAIGGVFLVKFTFSIPFPTMDQYCNAVGTSVLLTRTLPDCNPSAVHDTHTKQVILYPNPTSGTVHIANLELGSTVEIRAMDGRLMYGGRQPADGDFFVEHLPAGMYLVCIAHGGVRWCEKLVVY